MIQLVVGQEGPFLWKNPDSQQWEEKDCFLVPPNQAHECDACNKKILTLGVDPESSLGEHIITRFFKTPGILEYSPEFAAPLHDRQISPFIQNQEWDKIFQRIIEIFQFDASSKQLKRDPRIQQVLNYINLNLEHRIETKDLLQSVFLSESRLLHLFKAEMGLPIRNYILWCRIKKAFEHIANGHSLTETAYLAGFSDQAHLSRTFVKVMGLPPSAISKNSKFVQVFFPV